ncbi:MAG: hypothetical protein WCC11_03965, partial [Gammaproteobacteria bacterium]
MNMRLPAAARWIIWLVSLGLLCGIAWSRLDPHPINTDILAMLPMQHDSQALAVATERSRDAFVHELLILVSGDDTPQTRGAALAAQHALLAAGLHAQDSGQSLQRLLAAYKTHQFALLNTAQASQLARDGAHTLAMNVAVSLASPAGMVSAFGSDPGGYLARFLNDLPRPYPDFLPDGPFLSAVHNGQRQYLLNMQLSGAAFGEQGASQAANAVRDARAAVH